MKPEYGYRRKDKLPHSIVGEDPPAVPSLFIKISPETMGDHEVPYSARIYPQPKTPMNNPYIFASRTHQGKGRRMNAMMPTRT